MRLVLPLTAVLLLALGLAARADDGTAPGSSVRKAIENVIGRQLEAFRHDDGAAAFALASPTIQRMFGTPEAFMAMVRQSYRPVYRPLEVRFEDLLMHDGRIIERVRLVGPEHEVVIALYEMQRQSDDEWRINGCFLLPAPERAT